MRVLGRVVVVVVVAALVVWLLLTVVFLWVGRELLFDPTLSALMRGGAGEQPC